MAILTAADKPLYFPDVTLEGDALTGAIARITSIIEGPAGANRPLERGETEEIKRLNVAAQTAQLSYVPVALVPAPVIRARVSTVADWVELATDEYRIDFNGRLCILGSVQHVVSRWARHPYDSNQWRFSEVWATYTAGLDFTADTAEIRNLKAAAGQCLSFMVLNQAFAGVTRYEVFQEYVESYGSTSAAGDIPGGLLAPFFKYRPRAF